MAIFPAVLAVYGVYSGCKAVSYKVMIYIHVHTVCACVLFLCWGDMMTTNEVTPPSKQQFPPHSPTTQTTFIPMRPKTTGHPPQGPQGNGGCVCVDTTLRGKRVVYVHTFIRWTRSPALHTISQSYESLQRTIKSWTSPHPSMYTHVHSIRRHWPPTGCCSAHPHL